MGASPLGVCKLSQVCIGQGGGSGLYKSCHSPQGELFISLSSTLEQHYGWPAVENKEAKAFST